MASTESSDLNKMDCQLKGVKLLPQHSFTTYRITDTADSDEVQTLIALFRANGGRIPLSISNGDSKEVRDEVRNQVKVTPAVKKVEKLDVLDPVNHQKLSVLFCSYSYSSQNFPAFCVDPWVVDMHFYREFDIRLGSFLEKYCFRSSYVCPSKNCNTPMLDHVRRFVHDPGSIHLTLSRVEQFDWKQIVMWSWCSKCQKGTPIIPMSSQTWSFSFAKYLELRFRGHFYTRKDTDSCKHSLHHDHHQYFGMNNIVALFKFSTIHIWEICLPPPIINLQFKATSHNIITDELRNIAIKGHDIYSSVLERLHNFEGSEEEIQGMKLQQQKEHAFFKTKIEEIQLKLTSPALEPKKVDGNKIEKDRETEIVLWQIDDSIVNLKRMISEAVIEWNGRFQEALNAVKKKDDKEKEKFKQRVCDGSWKVTNQTSNGDSHENENKEEELSDDINNETTNTTCRKLSGSMSDSVDVDSDDNLSLRLNSCDPCDHGKRVEDPKDIRKSISENLSSCDECQLDGKQDKKSVKNILSQILTSNKDYFPIQSPWNQQEHYLLGVNCNIMVHENEPSSIISYALASPDYQRFMEDLQPKKLHTAHSSDGLISSPIGKRKNSILNVSAEKESENSDCRRSKLSFLRGTSQQQLSNQSSINRLLTDNSHHSATISNSSDGGNANSVDGEDKTEEINKKGGKTSSSSSITSSSHAEIIFGDATANFYCHIYFAEQFANLRRSVFPIGEEAFVRSLARCVHWAARGGKSGSTFCKTKDDRFILKEMSRLELQLFLGFANHYFNYIQKCHESNRPTLLGKIVGVYTVSFRNTNSNATLKCNLLVMENLFYKKNVAQKYDLKGSMRNRLVNPSNQSEGEIVYLDENLLQMITNSPLYILSHTQTVLMNAIESDTQFLASQAVMDYSLLVGLDEDRRELVVGIIDYIRTFTWDKRLETMVKKSVIMGGQGKQPTVIQPKDYRNRFISAMHRYFLPVPDRWSGMDKIIDTGNS